MDGSNRGDGDSAAAPIAAEAPGGNVEQIRDILFGVQMDEYDRRFVRLEERIERSAAELTAAATARLDSLEEYVKRELQELATQVRTEEAERGKALKGLSREVRDLGREVDKRLDDVVGRAEKQVSRLDSALASSARELREQILAQSKGLRGELAESHERLVESIAEETEELRGRKADRTRLATLLADMAAQLAGEPEEDGRAT